MSISLHPSREFILTEVFSFLNVEDKEEIRNIKKTCKLFRDMMKQGLNCSHRTLSIEEFRPLSTKQLTVFEGTFTLNFFERYGPALDLSESDCKVLISKMDLVQERISSLGIRDTWPKTRDAKLFFERCSQLTRLSLDHSSVDGTSFQNLCQCAEMQSLTDLQVFCGIQGNILSDEDLRYLKDLPKLQKLNLENCSAKLNSDTLSKCSRLTSLKLFQPGTQTLPVVAGCRNLRELELLKLGMKASVIEPFKNIDFQKLTSLNIQTLIMPSWTESPLSCFPQSLTVLKISVMIENSQYDAFFAWVGKYFQNLNTLKFEQIDKLKDQDIVSVVSGLPHLRLLYLPPNKTYLCQALAQKCKKLTFESDFRQFTS